MLEILVCGNPDCQIAKNGSCLQGHSPVESCPNFGDQRSLLGSNVEKNLALDLSPVVDETPNKLKLSTGLSFSQVDVDTFLLQKPSRLIAIVGDTSSGKTTLMCSLYDRFLRGSFAGRTFSGSATLTAFEQIAHHSRAISGAMAPDTGRTFMSQGLQFYHLATAPERQDGTEFHLFMSDRAGETYRSGMNNPAELFKLRELKFARVLVLLVDGARLVLPDEKHEVLDAMRSLVRSLVDSETVSEAQHLQVVLTKRDEVERSGYASDLVDDVKFAVDRLTKDFGTNFGSINYLEISARDPKSEYRQAFGCDDLLQSWINATDPEPKVVSPSLQLNKQFDRLARNLTYGAIE